NYKWSKSLGTLYFGASGLFISADGAGNVVVTGQFSGQIDLSGAGVDAGNPDFRVGVTSSTFVVGYDTDGAFRWGRSYATGEYVQAPRAQAMDKDGTPFLTAEFDHYLDPTGQDNPDGGAVLTGIRQCGKNQCTYQGVILKIDPKGEVVFSRVLLDPDGT